VNYDCITGRIFAIEQPSTMEGINEGEYNKILNCKIVSEEDISTNMMNNFNGSKIMAEKACQKSMDVQRIN